MKKKKLPPALKLGPTGESYDFELVGEQAWVNFQDLNVRIMRTEHGITVEGFNNGVRAGSFLLEKPRVQKRA